MFFILNNRALLVDALHRPSGKKKAGENCWEYRGDRVLKYIIPWALWNRYPNASQGDLARMKSLITCNENLALMALRLRLQKHATFHSKGRHPLQAHADALSSL